MLQRFSNFIFLPIVLGLAYFLLSLFVFITFTRSLLTNELAGFDQLIINIVRSDLSPTLTGVMSVISFFGSPSFIIGAIIGGLVYCIFIKKVHWLAVQLLVISASSWLLNKCLKDYFQRPRPLWPLAEAIGYSYPSGHAMVSISFYGFLIYLGLTKIIKPKLRLFVVAFLAILILLIGISRIYLGVHYPSDVGAGFAAGGSWLVVCVLVLNACQKKFSR
ncbi:phosphatase PAP2 family protein [Bacillota bacterium LX-D]|nr:phosphatase PAP2 family protein [Bacillota bacterium LX-D]